MQNDYGYRYKKMTVIYRPVINFTVPIRFTFRLVYQNSFVKVKAQFFTLPSICDFLLSQKSLVITAIAFFHYALNKQLFSSRLVTPNLISLIQKNVQKYLNREGSSPFVVL